MAGTLLYMAAIFTDRLAQLSYQKARRLLVATGGAVLIAVTLVTYARRVDSVEVVATLLFLPVFLAFVFRGVVGGLVAALLASLAYAGLRYPAIEAIGFAHVSGLVLSRTASYLIFGLVGGWSTQVLEGSLAKLELYDEVDDETGLSNARFLLHQTELEMARALRYETIFSVVVLDLPAAPFAALGSRRRRATLAELGRLLQAAVRTVDHVAHLRDGEVRRLVAILPETSAEGAATFAGRFETRVLEMLAARGVTFADPVPRARQLTFPGDEAGMEALRSEARRVDADQHAP